MAYRKKNYGTGKYYETKSSYNYYNSPWSFGSLLSYGFHGSIKRAKNQYSNYKRLKESAKIDYELRQYRQSVRKKSQRAKVWHNITTFFKR